MFFLHFWSSQGRFGAQNFDKRQLGSVANTLQRISHIGALATPLVAKTFFEQEGPSHGFIAEVSLHFLQDELEVEWAFEGKGCFSSYANRILGAASG